MLTNENEFVIVATDELPKTAGAEKRKDKTPAEERIVMNTFMYVIRSLKIGFFNSLIWCSH